MSSRSIPLFKTIYNKARLYSFQIPCKIWKMQCRYLRVNDDLKTRFTFHNSTHVCPQFCKTLQLVQPMSTHVQSIEGLFGKDSLQQYLNKLETEYKDCLNRIHAGGTEDVLRLLRRRVTDLAPVVSHIQQLRLKEQEFQDTEALLKDDDADIRDLAESERRLYKEAITDLKHKIISLLIPSEESDGSDLIMEVTAGVGGQEAMLFTAEMFDMYQNFASFRSWRFEILEYFPSEIGGLRHATASISGPASYKHMKYEGGVHRVQRVPKTEKQGRTHTSTMTVAILPLPTEINFTIHLKDLRIETKRASGAGGQHVNTTDSAVRILHIPTGVVSECQQERSQLKNKEKAMQVLRAKLYSMKLEEETSKRYNARKVQIGTKGRSEKIRTYNFPQDRVTDHRISETVHDIKGFMMGEELLDHMIQSLKEYEENESLLDILEENMQIDRNM
ncbi:peptide chain release factor 1-like, mitochondrial isoform X1 [Acipenser oxyrinchus oxyrinchus]|uniref:Peptide chain release factor 1-like, mitochondrial n=1 Tax=Acipenser oxyrinchus oxyrinchus TaxID=40147 RepID=A0AAD8LQX0_ACIOX|nr:peptide chain release factor 1-like, mitochondrial isoform X1 [Acipenser oxyrinchus oxyrinchus]